MGVIIRQSIKGTLANYIGIAVGFFTTFFILTHYLTAEEVGLTRVLVDAAILFSTLAQLGTNSSILRYYPYFKDEEKSNHGLFFWSLILPFIGFLLFLVCFFIFREKLIDVFQEKSALLVNYFYFIIPIAFFLLYMSVFEMNATILNRVAVPKFIREVFIRCGLLVGYLLFGYQIITLDGLVVVFCVVYGLGALLNLIYLLSTQHISFKPDFSVIHKQLVKDFTIYTMFMILSALVSSVLPMLSSFMISAKMGLTYAGIYAIANYIATIVEIPYRSLSAIVQPRISVAIKENNIPQASMYCQKVALHQFIAGTFIFLIIWMNIDLLFQMLPNGEEYATGKWVVFILSLSRLFNSTFGIGLSTLGYTKYYYYSLIFTFLVMGLSIGFNLWLIPLMGINGGAMATFLAYTIHYIILLWFIYYIVGTNTLSWGILKIAFIILGIYFLQFAIAKVSIPYAHSYSLFIQLIEAGLRTLLMIMAGIWIIYRLRISTEINQIIDTKLLKKHDS